MSGLSVEDFKNVLLDLYVTQRENADLRARLVALEVDAPAESVDEEA